jgi:hypothetical protein
MKNNWCFQVTKRKVYLFEKTAILLCALSLLSVFWISCATRPTAGMGNEFGGYWIEKDIGKVAHHGIEDCNNAPVFEKLYQEYGRKPVLTIGLFTCSGNDCNQSDVMALVSAINTELGKLTTITYVAQEQLQTNQMPFVSAEAANAFADDAGADVMLCGLIKTTVTEEKGNAIRTYTVHFALVEMLSGKMVWSEDTTEITKKIRITVK